MTLRRGPARGGPIDERTIRVDDLDVGAQPHCPDCHVVMRPVNGGDRCPECGCLERHVPARRPEDFDGPTLRGW